MADWLFYQEENERRESRVSALQESFQAQNQRDLNSLRRKSAAQYAKSIPTDSAIAWGSLGLGGCFAILLGLVVLVIASLALTYGMIRLTSHTKSGQPVPPQTTHKHHGRRHQGKSPHFSPRR